MSLDILDHDNGVVHHDADREHQAEQREIVDGKAECGHRRKGADERYRNRNDRDYRRPPALQKHQHDDHDEQHRLIDGLDQLVDRLGDELGRVVTDVVIEPLGETGLQFRHGVGNAFCRSKRIRSRPLRHQHRDRGLPQHEAVSGIVQRAQFDPGDIAQPHSAAAFAGLNDDVLELRHVPQPSREGEIGLEGAVGDRRTGELATRDLQVLGPDRGQNVACRHTEGCDLVGIKPQPHRVIAGAEDLDVADAVEPQQLVANLQQRVV